MASFESNVLDRWPAGTKLGVFPRLGDSFSAALPQVKSASVGQDGSVKVSGLDDGAPYWLAGEGRAVAFTAKDAEAKVQSPAVEAGGGAWWPSERRSGLQHGAEHRLGRPVES
jgi:hypothetical protein